MRRTSGKPLDYGDAQLRKEILDRQRREMWTPEQVASLARHFRLEPGMRMLDAGCGYGYCLRTFGPYCLPGGMLIGCDREEELLDTARYAAKRERAGGAAAFCAADLYRIPFSSGTFDICMAQVVLCHLADPERVLDEMIRVTRPGGCVVVIDNAHPIGVSLAWNNVSRLTIPQKLFRFEALLRWRLGRRRLGLGDFAVGCHMPGWMEARGLKDIDVRQNEKVNWIAPPYRSPAQHLELGRMRERLALPWWRTFAKTLGFDAWYRSGGADDAMIKRITAAGKRDMRKMKKALAKGTLAHSVGNWLWCIWGFK
jgi:SAM-dependent methyltransferase